jgi:uncharacterized spore protein YtfJ
MISASAVKNQEQAMAVLQKLFAVAEPGVIFGPPVTHADTMVITASEVSVGMGLGYGAGSGADKEGDAGSGGGGGGGGASLGRPVAVIAIGPRGLQVEPIVDPTKIVIALATALGAIFMSWRAMSRAARR